MVNEDEVVAITLTADGGRSLRLASAVYGDDGRIESYEATLTVPAGSVTTIVHEFGTGLPTFYRELADAWSGFDGTKSFASLEGDLYIEARHDGVGTVFCQVYLRQPFPPEWQFSAELAFGAGAHLNAVANQLEEFLG